MSHRSKKTPVLVALARSLFVVLLALGASAVAASEKNDRVRRSRSFELEFPIPSGSPTSLSVDNLFGEIRVSAGERGRIVAFVDETIRARDEGRADAAAREVAVEPSHSDGSVELFVDGPFRREDGRFGWRQHEDPGYTVRYDFRIEVPARTDLVLRTVTDGDIEVVDVAGEFLLRNVNGSVRLVGADGAGSIETVNGEIEARFDAPPAGDSRFETVNGEVVVTVPEGTGADLRLKSTYGELSSDFPFELLPRPEVVEETTESGKRRFRVGGFTLARIGGGGPALEMETLNGDVLVLRTKPMR